MHVVVPSSFASDQLKLPIPAGQYMSPTKAFSFSYVYGLQDFHEPEN